MHREQKAYARTLPEVTDQYSVKASQLPPYLPLVRHAYLLVTPFICETLFATGYLYVYGVTGTYYIRYIN